MQTEKIATIASALLSKTECSKTILSVMPLSGGANNRVFKIETSAANYLFKNYYYSEKDLRDRATTDFNFCSFVWNHGIQLVPQPIGIYHHTALYEFIEGRRLELSEITTQTIEQATLFFTQLNHYRSEASSHQLSLAAEACFSLKEHVSCIQERVSKLQSIKEDQLLGFEAKQLVCDQIVPHWNELVQTIDLTDNRLLQQEERCLSPSDFGFHNALLQADGTLRFFDFEYAGWDDPAKMMADFFCQPALPVPEKYFHYFCSRAAENFSHPEKIIQRATLLLPLYKIKWCCILLNEFLPKEASRRRFALTSISETERKQQQLTKVRELLAKLEKTL